MGLTQMVADLEQNLNNAMNQSGLHPTVLRLILESRIGELRMIEAQMPEESEENERSD